MDNVSAGTLKLSVTPGALCEVTGHARNRVYRAKDLGIISSSVAASLFQKFRQENWHHQEPGDPIPPEEPGRMKRFVLRALAEDVISPSRAAELLGMPLAQFWHEEATHHDGFPLPVYC